MVSQNPAILRAASEAARDVLSGGAPASQQHEAPERPTQINVGVTERNVSIVAGAALGLMALSRPLSLRGLAFAGLGGALIYRGVTGHCHLYDALGIDRTRSLDEPSADPSSYFHRGIHVEQAITIDKPAEELFRFWRDFENLPQIMAHLKDVKVIDATRSHWVAKAPLGFSVEWDAEIINEEPNRLIAWRSVGDAMVDNSGSVRFIEGERGTEVRVVIDYLPPAGQIAAMIARLFGREPSQQVHSDLKRFKQQMETGEVASNADDEPRGTCSTF
jgi:uncharacterized membrane protein